MMDETQILIDLAKIRETLAVQGQMLATIMSRIDQQTQQQAQQGAQIAQLIIELTVVKSEHAALRVEVAALGVWRADTQNQFIPRREQDAQRHEARLSALEQNERTNDDKQFNFLQWLVSNSVPIFLFLISLVFTLYNVLHH